MLNGITPAIEEAYNGRRMARGRPMEVFGVN
jgi:hypothetical protein